MIKEICFGLIGNFIFSLGVFAYKRYHHEKYDEIIRKLNKLEQIMAIENQYKQGLLPAVDDKLNLTWVPKEQYFNKNI